MADLMRHMTEAELTEHLNVMLRFIKARETRDTIGSMLVIFQDNGLTQYGGTIDPEDTPEALRELADRLERRDTDRRS